MVAWKRFHLSSGTRRRKLRSLLLATDRTVESGERRFVVLPDGWEHSVVPCMSDASHPGVGAARRLCHAWPLRGATARDGHTPPSRRAWGPPRIGAPAGG